MDKITPVLTVIDTLNIGFYLSALGITEDEEARLEECKQRSREGGTDFIEFRGKYFQVRSAKSHYAFVLINDDVTVKIAREVNKAGAFPEVAIEIRSRLLLAGSDDAYQLIRQWIEKWATIKSEKVSRADLAIDFQGDFKINPDNIVTRAHKEKAHFIEHKDRRKLTGYIYGSHNFMLRIYDKILEIKESRKEYIKEEWKQNGWDKHSPVWRVEVQLGRTTLKQFQVESYSDLKKTAPDIWRYATGKWFSERIPSSIDKTRSRWQLTDTWETVLNSFGNFGQLSGVVRTRVKDVKLDNIIAQIAGLETSASALIRSRNYQHTEFQRAKKGIQSKEIGRLVEDHYIKKYGIKYYEHDVECIIHNKMRKAGLFEESYAYYPETI